MLTQREHQQLQPPQIVQREEVLGVESRLQISSHQHRGQLLSRLSVVIVVQLGLSCLRDAVLLWRSLSLRGSHSQQSRLRRESR